MTTRRRRHKKAQARRPQKPLDKPPDAQGFDYGVGFGAVLLGDVEFPRLLSEANIRGLAYGFQYDPDLDAQLPYVSLIAGSSEPLAEAFKHFSGWAEGSDGDAVDLSWVFLRDGGYLFGLAPEARRLQHRCIGFQRHIAVRAAAAALWIKPIDTCGPDTVAFRNYCQVLGSPFLFGAAYCSLPTLALPRATQRDIRPMEGIRPLRKLSATLVDQDKVQVGSHPWIALQLRHHGKHARQKPPSFDPQTFFRDRRAILTAHFPVTLERIRALQADRADLAALAQKFAPWQVEQAICNVLLSYTLFGSRPHYPGVSAADLPDLIGRALAERVEQADGESAPLREVPTPIIEKQLQLDSFFLLGKASGKKPPALTSLQAALDAARLLHPRASLVSQ